MSDPVEGDAVTNCSACNATLSEGAKFCSECGTSTAATADATSPIETTFNAAVEFLGNVADETSKQVSGVLRDEKAQKIAGGAAVGAVAAVFLPVTLGVGALIGAGVVAYNQLVKK
jgi:hypothetical protein